MTAIERKEHVKAWAPVIGVRAAARKYNVNEDTACSWSHREQWPLPEVFRHPKLNQAKASERLLQAGASIAHRAMQDVVEQNGKDTLLYLSSAALKASHSAAEKAGSELLGKVESQAVLNTARSADIVHGWTAQRQALGVNVGVQVNVPLPDPKEREEMKAIDAKLDAIAAKLRE